MDDQTLQTLLHVQNSVSNFYSSRVELDVNQKRAKRVQQDYDRHKRQLATDIECLRNTLSEDQIYHLAAKAIGITIYVSPTFVEDLIKEAMDEDGKG